LPIGVFDCQACRGDRHREQQHIAGRLDVVMGMGAEGHRRHQRDPDRHHPRELVPLSH
jgi:hypothetical protein